MCKGGYTNFIWCMVCVLMCTGVDYDFIWYMVCVLMCKGVDNDFIWYMIVSWCAREAMLMLFDVCPDVQGRYWCNICTSIRDGMCRCECGKHLVSKKTKDPDCWCGVVVQSKWCIKRSTHVCSLIWTRNAHMTTHMITHHTQTYASRTNSLSLSHSHNNTALHSQFSGFSSPLHRCLMYAIAEPSNENLYLRSDRYSHSLFLGSWEENNRKAETWGIIESRH